MHVIDFEYLEVVLTSEYLILQLFSRTFDNLQASVHLPEFNNFVTKR